MAGSIMDLSQLRASGGPDGDSNAVTDKDGGITVSKWEWAKVAQVVDTVDCPTTDRLSTSSPPPHAAIPNASSAAYTPSDEDEGDVVWWPG